MRDEAILALGIQPDGRYWDGTFGRGGHSELLLSLLSTRGALFASDWDAEAAAAASKFEANSRFTFFSSSLSQAAERLEPPLQGFLMDLGVSTPQLKSPERGFSFTHEGPLDMRMDQKSHRTALSVMKECTETELADLIFRYGEERFSRKIAKWIKEALGNDAMNTTLDLAQLCYRAYPRKHHRIHPATRTFQALRIEVNDELRELTLALERAVALLAPGGRGVVISFHSLEDRLVKHYFRQLEATGDFRVIGRKPLQATEEEQLVNPPSRSAKLRIIERNPEKGEDS
jgi:16S rRNA (cytosine1402-N4)-methyltransferase